MKTLPVLLAIFALTGITSAADLASLGHREDTVLIYGDSDTCIGSPIQNHDSSFENGYCWQLAGTAPPYFGAFGEAFDVGDATVECAVYWLSQIGYPWSDYMDVYIWDGGVTRDPAGVTCLVPNVLVTTVGYWPTCTRTEVAIDCCVSTEFTIGYWDDNSNEACWFYICADENGPGGHPWTNIAPGIGYPSGWQNPNVVWPDCVSLAIDATLIESPSPAESRTWGSIKAMFE